MASSRGSSLGRGGLAGLWTDRQPLTRPLPFWTPQREQFFSRELRSHSCPSCPVSRLFWSAGTTLGFPIPPSPVLWNGRRVAGRGAQGLISPAQSPTFLQRDPSPSSALAEVRAKKGFSACHLSHWGPPPVKPWPPCAAGAASHTEQSAATGRPAASSAMGTGGGKGRVSRSKVQGKERIHCEN